MSSRAGKMTKQVKPETYSGPVKTAVYRIDFEITRAGEYSKKSTTVEVSGIPKSISHEDYDKLAQHTAQTTFCSVLNQRTFLETYPFEQTAKSGVMPIFINLFKSVDEVQVKKVEWLEEKENIK